MNGSNQGTDGPGGNHRGSEGRSGNGDRNAPKGLGLSRNPLDPQARRARRRNARFLARALLLPTELALMPLVGFYAGYLADKKWHTRPWLLLLGGLVGFGAALASLRRLLDDR